ncbi:MAG: DUF3617 family protein, partial [Rhodanobacter sp.]
SVMAVLAMPIGAAYAIDHPPMKEGLWQIRLQTISNPDGKKSESTMKVCRDHAFDKSTEAMATKMAGCTTIDDSLSGGVYSNEMRCKMGGSVVSTKTTFVYKGDTAVHSDTHVTYIPAMYGMGDQTVIEDQAYLSSCPAGMKPGDLLSPDGTVQHSHGH